MEIYVNPFIRDTHGTHGSGNNRKGHCPKTLVAGQEVTRVCTHIDPFEMALVLNNFVLCSDWLSCFVGIARCASGCGIAREEICRWHGERTDHLVPGLNRTDHWHQAEILRRVRSKEELGIDMYYVPLDTLNSTAPIIAFLWLPWRIMERALFLHVTGCETVPKVCLVHYEAANLRVPYAESINHVWISLECVWWIMCAMAHFTLPLFS